MAFISLGVSRGESSVAWLLACHQVNMELSTAAGCGAEIVSPKTSLRNWMNKGFCAIPLFKVEPSGMVLHDHGNNSLPKIECELYLHYYNIAEAFFL